MEKVSRQGKKVGIENLERRGGGKTKRNQKRTSKQPSLGEAEWRSQKRKVTINKVGKGGTGLVA